jgi:type II secretory pathway pseudopilin PulG
MKSKASAFTVVELLVAAAIIVVLCVVAVPAVWGAYKSSSLAVSSNNIRQLAAGGAAYLADNNYQFWAYRRKGEVGGTNGRVWCSGLIGGTAASTDSMARFGGMGSRPAGVSPNRRDSEESTWIAVL